MAYRLETIMEEEQMFEAGDLLTIYSVWNNEGVLSDYCCDNSLDIIDVYEMGRYIYFDVQVQDNEY